MTRNKVIAVSGVSGAGKTFLIEALLAELPDVSKLTTVTTRPKRDNELDSGGKKFIDEVTFNRMSDMGELFIVNTVFNYRYAFDLSEFSGKIQKSHVVLELKLEDLKQIKEFYEPTVSIYIYPSEFDKAVEHTADRNAYDIRVRDTKEELAGLRARSLPDFDLIDVFLCNNYDNASICAFITAIKKVLDSEI